MAKCKYTEDFPLLAEGMARDGLNDEQIAKKLGISKVTFYDYQKKYPNFFNSIKKGKAPVDTEVENALFKRAMGYEVEEVKEEISDIGGKKTTRTIKHIAGDTTAQIFWLKNRKPDQWNDQKDTKNEVNIDTNKITEEMTAEDASRKYARR